MAQSLSIRADSAFVKDSVSFCPQPWDRVAPLRTEPSVGAAPTKLAYAPFSLGFRDTQPKKPQPHARDSGTKDHPAQVQTAQAQVHALVAFDGFPMSGSSEDEGAERRFPQKNTFIHFDIPDSRVSTLTKEQIARWRSAPCIIQTAPYHTKYPEMEQAHIRNECKPCAYHCQKTDGCRWGEQCSFCHLCPTGEIKRRKKAKVHAIKVQGIRAKCGGARKMAAEKEERVSP